MNFDVIKPDEISIMYQQAANKREMVKILSQLTCSDENDICDILGIPHVKKRTVKCFDEEKALEMYNNGATEKEIAKAFGVACVTVYAWKLKAGLVQHSPEREKRFETVRKLYDLGLTDPQISEKTGLSIQMIYLWRRENALKANWSPGKDWAEVDAKFRPHYEKGLTDKQIADICGCNSWNVRDWRQREKLVSNAIRGRKRKTKEKCVRAGRNWLEIDRICRPLYESGLNDPEIEKKTGIDKRTVCEWRKREKLPSQRSLKS